LPALRQTGHRRAGESSSSREFQYPGMGIRAVSQRTLITKKPACRRRPRAFRSGPCFGLKRDRPARRRLRLSRRISGWADWAEDRRAVELAFAERTAAVAAHVVDRVKFSLDIEHTDRFAFDIDALAAARLDVAGFADFDEVGHSRIPFSFRAKVPINIRS